MKKTLMTVVFVLVLTAGCDRAIPQPVVQPLPPSTAETESLPASAPATDSTAETATSETTAETPPESTPSETAGRIVCKDGSVSRSAHRQGACSHHGGIR
jgi:hypothetical protein